jgi:hypothetical protein
VAKAKSEQQQSGQSKMKIRRFHLVLAHMWQNQKLAGQKQNVKI